MNVNISNEPLVSIVVPVYQVESYIDKCLKSIMSQTYTNIEIIVVDDGSTDRSGEICDSFSLVDDRFVVIHKDNKGLSDARNVGIHYSNGDYIAFIDGDDYASSLFIETLLVAALENNCDISCVPYGTPFMDGDDCQLKEDSIKIGETIAVDVFDMQRMLLYQKVDTGAQWHMFRKSVLGANPFPEGLYYEDLATIYKVIKGVKRVALVNECRLYAYRIRSNSIMSKSFDHLKSNSAIIIASQLYENISWWYPELDAAASSRCFSLCRMVYAQALSEKEATKNDRALLWNELDKHKRVVVKDKYARKRERIAAFFACIGMNSFSLFCRACRFTGLMR